ncbi:MAG TPA: 5'-3' exonuclease H3TH domain-containing protein [Polyangiaceae bacterium]
MTAPVLLIDTYSLFFRAHHALPPMSTKASEPTAAIYGFSSLLLKLLREQPGAALAFALDEPTATFRHDSYEAYKAGRPATPSALAAQFGRLNQLLAAFAVPTFRCPGFEADDVLATLALRARSTAQPALVVSGDRDLLQLARGSVKVYFVGRRGKDALVYDGAQVLLRFGVPAEVLPSYVALVGDPSDNLPGVPGIGAATARGLLASKQSCLDLLQDLAAVKNARTRQALASHSQQILETERLARLREDARIPAQSSSWSTPAPAAWDALGKLFDELEFKSLHKRLDLLKASWPAGG